MYVVFLGAPGAGKGTQAVVVAERLGLAHLATGDLLREAVRRETVLGQQAKSFMQKGELVPDDLVIAMILERLSADDAKAGAIFDGFPRNVSQAQALDRALAQRGAEVNVAVHLKVTEPALVLRLSGRWLCKSCGATYHQPDHPPRVTGTCDRCSGELYQREDDKPETVKRRLQVFLEQTEPLLAYYAGRGRLAEVDGEGPIAVVAERVMNVITAAVPQPGRAV